MAREVLITNSSLNAYGYRVLTSGLDTSQYERNPIILYMHERWGRESAPIGIMLTLRIDGDNLYGTPEFDLEDEFARKISNKWEKGHLRMVSMGIDIVEASEAPEHLVPGQTRPTVTKSKLTEVSIVDMGANDDALQVALYKDGKRVALATGMDSDVLPLLKLSKTDDQIKLENRMDKILLALGLPTGTSEEDAAKYVQTLKQQNEQITLARITEIIDAAVLDRRINADQKAHFIELGKSAGTEKLNETLKLFTATPKPSDIPNEKSTRSVTLKKFDEYSATELELMRSEDKDGYAKLYKEHFGIELKKDE